MSFCSDFGCNNSYKKSKKTGELMKFHKFPSDLNRLLELFHNCHYYHYKSNQIYKI